MENTTRQRRVRALLRLAGGDPATTDPEQQYAHAKAEYLNGGPLEWVDYRSHRRILSSIDEILEHVGVRT